MLRSCFLLSVLTVLQVPVEKPKQARKRKLSDATTESPRKSSRIKSTSKAAKKSTPPPRMKASTKVTIAPQRRAGKLTLASFEDNHSGSDSDLDTVPLPPSLRPQPIEEGEFDEKNDYPDATVVPIPRTTGTMRILVDAYLRDREEPANHLEAMARCHEYSFNRVTYLERLLFGVMEASAEQKAELVEVHARMDGFKSALETMRYDHRVARDIASSPPPATVDKNVADPVSRAASIVDETESELPPPGKPAAAPIAGPSSSKKN